MKLDKNTRFYLQAAQAYKLPCHYIESIAGFSIRLGRRHYLFHQRATPFNHIAGAELALDKFASSQYLRDQAIPVPKSLSLWKVAYKKGLLNICLDELDFPLVIKPVDNGLGRGVICNIKNKELLIEELEKQFQKYPRFLIEEYHANLKSYRVLVFYGRIIGLIFREGAHVYGDGQHSIAELIQITNEKRAQQSEILKPMMVDRECQIALEEQGFALEEIPKKGQKIRLGYTSNASRGGSFKTLPLDLIHPENKKILMKTADLIGLNLLGIDLECQDICRSIRETPGYILEVNHRPSIRIHEEPLDGPQQSVAKIIIRRLIYRHPLAYFKILYQKKPTSIFIKTAILLIFTGILFKILS